MKTKKTDRWTPSKAVLRNLPEDFSRLDKFQKLVKSCKTFGRLSLFFLFPALLFAQAPSVSSFTPTRNALNVLSNTNITVTFSGDINSSTLTNSTIKISGSLSGPHTAAYSYNSSTKTVTITPATPFKIGDVVATTLTRDIKSAVGDLLANAYNWSFTVKAYISWAKFTQSSTPSVGSNPYSVTTGDFNGDGSLDLAVANSNSNTVSILLNNGNGTFTQSSTPSVGSSPISVTAGDFNGDGSLDLAVANSNSNTVSILLNNGSGTFTQSSTPSVGNKPTSVTTGDFNGDGFLDLAVANWNSSTASILLNNGSGTFTQNSTPSVGNKPTSVTTGDFNGDGFLDLAVANYNSNTVSILLNNGSGTFTQSSTPSVGSYPQSVTTGDFNGDGYLDLAVANSNSNTVSILLNNGSGTFTQSSAVSVGGGVVSVTTGDFNGDGALDLAVTNFNSYGDFNTVSILLNNGSGTFTQSSAVSVGDGVVSVTTGDFNGDGALDLAVVNAHSNNVSILMNQSPIPSAPQNLTAAAGNGQVTLKWNKNTEVDFLKYRIYRGTDSLTLTLKDSTTSGISDTTITIHQLTNNQKYYFRVTAIDSLRLESGFSNEVSATPVVPPPPPSLMLPVNGASNESTVPTLVWSSVPGATQYALQIATDSTSVDSIIFRDTITDTTRIAARLAVGSTYFWKVSSSIGLNVGPFSPYARFTVSHLAPVGDYTDDGKVRLEDVAIFIKAWQKKDTFIGDIGPAIGNAPNFQTIYDGKINFEDLMVLAQMYDWSLNVYPPSHSISGKELGKRLSSGLSMSESKLSKSNQSSSIITFKTEGLSATRIAEIQLFFNPGHIQVDTLSPGNQPANLFLMKHINNIGGFASLVAANLSDDTSNILQNGNLITVCMRNISGTRQEDSLYLVIKSVTSQGKECILDNEVFVLHASAVIPETFQLGQNYPNPFNPSTTVEYQLPKDARVILKLYNILGQEIKTLVDENQKAGYYKTSWNGMNNLGIGVSSGVYLIRMQADDYVSSKKIVLIR